MKKLSLITIPDQLLYEVTQKVTSFDNELQAQVDLMREFLKTQDGAGLAANQIGFSNRVIVTEFEDADQKNAIPFYALINPEIVEFSDEKEYLDEGCLSVPQIELPVERARKVKIRFQNTQGKIVKLAAKDILARILQHEIDHLNGIIFTEKIKEKFLADDPNFKNLQIVFFGSGQFGATILEGLILLGLKVNIITEKAKPSGRKMEFKSTPVAELAEKFGKKFTEIENISQFSVLSSQFSRFDLIICADFGQKIPEDILKSAQISAVNIHPSLLPKYRGATPIQTVLLKGEKFTGVSIIKMSPEIDQGNILAQIKTEILPDDNTLTLTNRLATLSLKLLFEALPGIAKNELRESRQDEDKTTLTRKFQKSDGEIDWKRPVKLIERQIRAFYPWPGSYTFINNQRFIIHKSHIEDKKLVLDMVQIEGGKPVKWSDFLRGYHDSKPEWFTKVK